MVAKRKQKKRENDYSLIAAQNNALMINYMKTKIDMTEENSKCKRCCDRNETVNPRSDCSRLAQKVYKSRYNWVGKVVHLELCKWLKTDYTDKWCKHKSEFVLKIKLTKFSGILGSRRVCVCVGVNRLGVLREIVVTQNLVNKNKTK